MSFSPPHPDTAFETALLDEARHRHANEYAAALAALQLVRAGLTEDQPLITEAIQRLEGGIRIERFLLNPGNEDLAMVLLELCSLLSHTRIGRPRFRVRVLGQAIMRSPLEMRLFLLVAYELLANAAKRASDDQREVSVRLALRRGKLRLTVVNLVAPGHATIKHRNRSGGLDVLRRLVAPVQGRIATSREDGKFVAQAIFPIIEAAPSTSTQFE